MDAITNIGWYDTLVSSIISHFFIIHTDKFDAISEKLVVLEHSIASCDPPAADGENRMDQLTIISKGKQHVTNVVTKRTIPIASSSSSRVDGRYYTQWLSSQDDRVRYTHSQVYLAIRISYRISYMSKLMNLP